MTSGPATAVLTRPQRRDIALLRVVAIVGVVAIHVSGLVVTARGLRDEPVWWLGHVLNSGSRFCVPLFVMVSGALLLRPSREEPAREFYRRRLDRLVPALVVWYVVYIAFSRFVVGTERGPGEVLALVLSGRTYTGLYFFWLILGLYLATPALRKLLAGLDGPRLLAVGLLLTALAVAWNTANAFVNRFSTVDVDATPNAFSYWIPYVGYFVLGAALSHGPVSRRVAPWAAGALGLTTVVSVLETTGRTPGFLTWLAPVDYLGGLVAVATVTLFLVGAALLHPTEAPSVLDRLVHTLGGLTLGVFATHLMVLYALQRVVVDEGVVPRSVPALLLLLAGTVAISFAVAWVMSRIPGLRRLV